MYEVYKGHRLLFFSSDVEKKYFRIHFVEKNRKNINNSKARFKRKEKKNKMLIGYISEKNRQQITERWKIYGANRHDRDIYMQNAALNQVTNDMFT